MFEQLEQRQMFSVTPISQINPTAQVHNGVLTEEQVTMGELYWSFRQAAQLSQYTLEQLQNTTQWVVWTVDPTSGNAGGASFNPYLGGSNISLLNTAGMDAGLVISQLSTLDNLVSYYPLVDKTAKANTFSALDEPLFGAQWHLRNTGQEVGSGDFQVLVAKPGEDINVVGAWNSGITGAGVIVGVVDSGLQSNHPDLVDNYIANLSFDFTNNTFNPSPTTAGSHGTAVAGLIAADGNNAYGTVGVAYNAGLVNMRIGTDAGLTAVGTDAGLARVLTYRNDVIDIYNHSWGYNDGTRAQIPLGPLAYSALRESIRFGRPNESGTPLGSIHVFASGNSAGHDLPPGFPNPGGIWDSATYNALINRYTIGVGGVDHDGTPQNADGTFTNYPETGPNVLVVAPTGSVSLDIGFDTGTGSGIWTTDLVANGGYNQTGTNDGDPLLDTNFTSRFNGTSAAAPQVSGVIALMLEANPNLSYRDVQEILIRSARQNDSISDPNGPTASSLGWQTNFIELFQAPVLDPLTLFPAEDPYNRLDGYFSTETSIYGAIAGLKPIDDYGIRNLPVFTNGAGNTVNYSRGIFSEEVGWAHGVVDADLAVKLAKQWHAKGQNRPAELTYTTFVRQFGNSSRFSNSSRFGISYGGGHIPEAALVGPDGDPDRYVIPGIMSGRGTEFEAFYDEFWAQMPFQQTNPADVPEDDNGSPLPLRSLQSFTPPLMEIEWIEVKTEIYGLPNLNTLRIALRSPDGTISDLNSYFQIAGDRTTNYLDMGLIIQGGLTAPNTSEPFVYTFSTNRHWGERSDDYFEIDPVTGQTRVDPDLATLWGFGAEIERRWELIVENYDPANDGYLDTFEVIFHGKPLQAGSERISGKIGVDAGWGVTNIGAGDGDFNFSRVIGSGLDANGDNFDDWVTPDFQQEPFASNITVRARDLNGNIVAQFVTGADGAYHFDLVAGTYTIEIVDPLGRTAKQDAGLNPRYQKTWTVTIDPNDQFTRNAGRLTPVDANGDGIQDFDDQNNNGIQDPNEMPISRYEMYTDVDFLLEDLAQTSDEVQVSGFVFSDVNGDGVFNGSDTEAKNFLVYADMNNSGAYEQGEFSAFSDDNGNYSFVVDGITTLQNIVIRARPLNNNWTPTGPVTARQTLLLNGGDVATNINFGFRPPVDTAPGGGGDVGDPGTIIGLVYSDRNGNGVQDQSDGGVPGVRVYADINANGLFDYVDANNNGTFDVGEDSEPTDITNVFGGYFLAEVDPGIVRVRAIVPADWLLTSPAVGYRQVTLIDGGQLNNVSFGIQNQATADFGDLPNSYQTTLASNGPRHHIVPGFRLGALIDGETNGKPSANADGDDLISGDEDGVVLRGAVGNPTGVLVAGTTNYVQVTVFGVGGYLNAWLDFNGDGDFNDAGEHALVDVDLNPGLHAGSNLWFEAPANMAAGPIAARFRWGNAGLNYFGEASIGEVEDYFFANANPLPAVVLPAGDYDGNGVVDDADYNLWRNNFGSTTNLAADGNNNGVVDAADYSVWRDNYGKTASSGGGGVGLAGDAPVIGPVARPTLPAADPLLAMMSQITAAALQGLSTGVFSPAVVYSSSVGSSSSAELGGSAGLAGSSSSLNLLSIPGLQFSSTASAYDTTFDQVRVMDAADELTTGDLLLVDQVLSRFVSEDDEANTDLALLDSEEELGNCDLALAAAFEEEGDWWTTL